MRKEGLLLRASKHQTKQEEQLWNEQILWPKNTTCRHMRERKKIRVKIKDLKVYSPQHYLNSNKQTKKPKASECFTTGKQLDNLKIYNHLSPQLLKTCFWRTAHGMEKCLRKKKVKWKGWMQNDVCRMFPVWFKKQTRAKDVAQW